MTPCPRRAVLLAMIGWLAVAAPAAALPDSITDETGFFDATTLAEVAGIARDLKRDFGFDLVIVPVKTVPPDKAKQVQSMKVRNREHFFERWAEERANNAGIDGVLVLICKEPYRVAVHVTPSVHDTFSKKDGERLRHLLVEKFEKGPKDRSQFNQGLLEGVEFVRDKVAEHHDPKRASRWRFDWWWVAWVLGGIAGTWLVVHLAGRWLRRRGPASSPPLPASAPGLPGTPGAVVTGHELCQSLLDQPPGDEEGHAGHLAETLDYGPRDEDAHASADAPALPESRAVPPVT